MAPPRIVLITGANSGVGLAIAKVLTSPFLSTDYHVILTARSLSKAQAAKSEIEIENPNNSASRLSTVSLDVNDPASITLARDFVEEEFGRLDALINNAAVGGIHEPDVYARYKVVMDTNVVGPAVVADLFPPLLLRSSNPYSIFVSGGAGSFRLALERLNNTREKPRELENGGAYHVSKAALNMLALREHIRFADQGLKVFAMSPGFVVSKLRGTSEELRSGWGKAGPASVAGETMLSILEGNRDDDVGKFVSKDGVYEW